MHLRWVGLYTLIISLYKADSTFFVSWTVRPVVSHGMLKRGNRVVMVQTVTRPIITPTAPFGRLHRLIRFNTSSSTSSPLPGQESPDMPPPRGPRFTHLDSTGRASMVSISSKASTVRRAVAKGRIRIPRDAYDMLSSSDPTHGGRQWKKGDVLGTSRIAGIMAGKRTSELIPLCHPLALTDLKVSFRLDRAVDDERVGGGWVSVKTVAECQGQTGVEVGVFAHRSLLPLFFGLSDHL